MTSKASDNTSEGEEVKNILPKEEPSSRTCPSDAASSQSVFFCQVCLQGFSFVQDLRQHLKVDGCQPLDNNQKNFTCNLCQKSFPSVSQFKEHRLKHSDKMVFTCMACNTSFSAKRALDRHMYVDASILNKLMASSDPSVKLPDMLCSTVVENLAVKAKLIKKRNKSPDSSLKDVQGEEHLDNEDDEGGDSEEEEEMDEDPDDDEEVDGEMAEEEDEDLSNGLADDASSVHSEMEEDSDGDRGSNDEETSTMSQPFLTSSLTDAPMTPFAQQLDGEDSVSQTVTEDATMSSVDTALTSVVSSSTGTSSSSRRKSRRPMPIYRPPPNPVFGKTSDDELEPDENRSGEGNSSPSSLYLCTMCGESLPSDELLSCHIAEHEKLFPYFCALCDANFCEGRLLKMHVASCHTLEQSLQCQMCGMYFKQRGSLATHAKYCREAPACVVCGQRFPTGADLEKHYYSHTEEERAAADTLSCTDCGEVFLSTIQLKEHLKTHGELRPYSCDTCGATFTQQRSLDKHQELHRRQQECRCEICGVQLLTRSGYMAHKRGHKNMETIQVGIEEQGRFSNLRKVKIEEKSEDMDTFQYFKLLETEINSTLDTASLTQARKRKPKKSESNSDRLVIKIHPCPFCSLTCTSADRLQVHIRRMHKDKATEQCDICNKRFYGKEYLEKHRCSHANYTDRFPCDQCSKVFRRKWSLETHRKIHTFKKFVQCDICGEEFRFISEVDKHKHRAHQYDKDQALYECNICKMKFASLSHLSIHSSHSHRPSDGFPFKCSRCHSLFLTCIDLKKHIYRSHEADACTPIKQEPPDTYENAGDSQGQEAASGYNETSSKTKQKPADDPPYEASVNHDGDSQSMQLVPKLEAVEDPEGAYNSQEASQSGVDVYNELTRQSMVQSRLLKRFICETCRKCFATKSDLRTHIRTHTGETPYKCEYCDRAFKQRGHRKLHIQVAHTKDMPYKCEICGQSYPTRYRYQIHLKRHTGIKEHQCEYCDKAYYTVGKLNEHKRKHHKDEMEKDAAMT